MNRGGVIPGGPVLVTIEPGECVGTVADRFVCRRIDTAHVVAAHRYAFCSCRHAAGAHLHGMCHGVDSYEQPCTCPSFDLSQECREALERGEPL